MKTTLATPTAEQMEALWGGRPAWRVMPCFAGAGEIQEAKEMLARVMGDDDLLTTIDARDVGISRLLRMASSDERCVDLAAAADMLSEHGPEWSLVLGWSMD